MKGVHKLKSVDWRSLLQKFLLCALLAGMTGSSWSAEKTPTWRGFNLLEKFRVEKNRPFAEDDFKWISQWGFNFVRLPMDYRCWIKNGDWNQIDEEQLKQIDQAVEWGRKYKVHVCINFHRAPGYCVGNPKEPKNLWTDEEAQTVCAKHWSIFAKRYKDIPSSELSFNLVNEPSGVDNAGYFKVAKILVEAIRKEDPDRLIFADGNQSGHAAVEILTELNVAFSPHCYQPQTVTHYQAPWATWLKDMPYPQWPTFPVARYFYGPRKPDLSTPLVLNGNFDESELLIHINVVSATATLKVRADDKDVFEKELLCGPGTGEWKEANFVEKYKIWQNTYDRQYSAKIPAKTKKIEVKLTSGDWITIKGLELRPLSAGKKSLKIEAQAIEWGDKQPVLYVDENGALDPQKSEMVGRAWLKQKALSAWLNLQAKGHTVMVQEFGCYNKTPHDVVLRWMEDSLKNYKESGLSWALWNFRGHLGVMDSERQDVQYEDFNGHKLDRKMLKLLQSY